MWFILAAGLLQEGLGLAARVYVRSMWGGEMSVRVHLFSARVDSRRGWLLYNGTRVSWQGLGYTVREGLVVHRLVLGAEESPLALAVGCTARSPFTAPSISIEKLDLNPMREGWRRMFGGRPAGGGGWTLNIPLELYVRKALVGTPAGSWEGSLWLKGAQDGKSGFVGLDVSPGGGLRLEASGRWNAEGGRLGWYVNDGKSGSGGGVMKWTRDDFFVKGDLWREAMSWKIDGRGERGRGAEFLLWSLDGKGRISSLPIRLAAVPGAEGAYSTVEIDSGSLRLPDVQITKSAECASTFISVESVNNLDLTGTEGRCITVATHGKIIRLSGEGTLEYQGNLNLAERGDVSCTWYLDGRLDRFGIVEKMLPSLQSWGHVRRDRTGFWSAAGGLESPMWRASFEADGHGAEAKIEGAIEGGLGEAQWHGTRKGDRWNGGGRFSYLGPKDGGGALPLPSGPLRGAFSVEGRGGGLDSCRFDAQGKGAWSFSLAKGSLSLDVVGAGLQGMGMSVSGMSGRAGWKGFSSSGSGEWDVDLRARRLLIAGRSLAGVEVRGRGTADEGTFGVKTAVPFLEGGLSGQVMLRKGRMIQLERVSGAVLDRKITFSEGRAALHLDGGLHGAWSCGEADILGASVEGLKGTVGSREGEGGMEARGEAALWGGTVEAAVGRVKDAPARLTLKFGGIGAEQAVSLLRRLKELPLAVSAGSLSGTVTVPLETIPDGLRFDLSLAGVSVEPGGGERKLRGVSGGLEGSFAGGRLEAVSHGLSLERGTVPVDIGIKTKETGADVTFKTPTLPLADLQNAVFDFLPEYVAYGSVAGRGAISGQMEDVDSHVGLRGSLDVRSGSFLSEDKALRIRDVDGRLPFVIHDDAAKVEVLGFSVPARSTIDGALGIQRQEEENAPMRIGRIRYSVFHLDNAEVYPSVDSGVVVLHMSRGDLWDGRMRAEMRLAVSTEGLRYAAQVILKDVGLKPLCDQSGKLAGFLSGDVSGSLTVSGQSLGLGEMKGILDVWSDPSGTEPRTIAREFLVKMGGERIRSLLKSSRLKYDDASLRCGLDRGIVTFYDLELFHEANPVKALFRKDVSFELKVPGRNTISVWQLLNHIKGLESLAAGSDGSPGAPRPN
jgi:hypothetical protein